MRLCRAWVGAVCDFSLGGCGSVCGGCVWLAVERTSDALRQFTVCHSSSHELLSSPHAGCLMGFSQAAHTSSMPETGAISSDFYVIVLFRKALRAHQDQTEGEGAVHQRVSEFRPVRRNTEGKASRGSRITESKRRRILANAVTRSTLI